MKKAVRILVLCIALTLVASFAGCGDENLQYEEQTQSNQMTVQAKDFYKYIMSREGQTVLSEEGLVPNAELSTYPAYDTAENTYGGKVFVTGSTSVQPAMNVLAEEYNKLQPGVEIIVSGTGSGQGREEAAKGNNSTFGIVSSSLNDTQKQTLKELKMGTDGVAVIVPKSITAPTSLTAAQITAIFKKVSGATNWSDFGGSEQSIVLYVREASSGTREAFEKPLKLEDVDFEGDNANVIASTTGNMIDGVRNSRGGIGYASFADVDSSVVNVLSVDGVACSADNIKNGTYKIARPFSLVVAKDMAL